MARITIEKYFATAGEYWVNVYHTAGSIGDAGSVAAALVAAELPLYYPLVSITKLRIDDAVANTDLFATVIVNSVGTRAATSDPLPLFAVGRVDFTIQGQGRPGRKYIRGCLMENDTASFALAAGTLTLLNNYAAAVVAAGVTDPDGQAVTAGSAFTQVGMRQLRRGSKKKTTP